MMSSEEESECVAKQQEQTLLVLKKSKRMRQRVDAGEPRNSYASIPNFSSRPQVVTGGYQSSANNNGYTAYDDEDDVDLAEHKTGISSSSSSSNSFLTQGHRMLLQPKVEKFENMCSSAAADEPAVKREALDDTSTSSCDTNGDENSRLLREILQGGGGAAAPAAVQSALRGIKSSGGGIISQLLQRGGGAAGSKEEAGTLVQLLLSSDESQGPEAAGAISPTDTAMDDAASRDAGDVEARKTPPGEQPAAAALSPAAGATPSTPSAPSPAAPQPSAACSDADLKRARVENIISSMRSSPFRPQPANGGCKKRKLYLPQQHDSKAAAHDYEELDDEVVAAKQRRTGCQQEVLRQQLSQMQKQIAAIQMKLDSYDQHNGGSDTDPMDSPRGCSDDGEAARPPGPPAAGRADAGPEAGGSPLHFHLGYVGGHPRGKPADHLEPGHFIDEARRLVSEQERLARAAEPKAPAPRGDWERLADSLKTGMASLIDDWVRRCAASKAGRQEAKEAPQHHPTTTCAPPAASLTSSSQSAAAASHHAAPCVPTSSASACISAFSSSAAAAANAVALHGLADRRSPRTKVIDRGRMGGVLAAASPSSMGGGQGAAATAAAVHELFKYGHLGELHHLKHTMSGLFHPPPKPPLPLYVPHPQPQQPLSFYGGGPGPMGGLGGGESPEQSEALPLVVTHKKKRHKVTDTRITPRTVSRLLQGSGQQDDGSSSKLLSMMNGRGSPVEGGVGAYPHPGHPHHSPVVPVSLPTSVAIPNPSLHQSDVYSPYPYYHHPGGHPRGSPNSDGDTSQLFHPHQHHPFILRQQSSPEPPTISYGAQMKAENGGDSSDCNSADMMYDGSLPTSSTLTPMHLRKAKLMFFYVRYPSSAILKTYFPDIKFNKNNTAQLVKWFSNFREFYYIQMEKYARQAISEGCKVAEDLTVTTDSELYRVLNLHYNRNNHIEVPVTFRYVVEQTLREFFKAIFAGKDTEQSWKKSIYKVIARMDDNLPEYFKSPNFLEQLE